MTLDETCLFHEVFKKHPEELPDAMFLQASSDCHVCNGYKKGCPDFKRTLNFG